MRTLLLLLMTLVLHAPSLAQHDSLGLVNQANDEIDTLKLPLQKTDSLAQIFNNRLKSIDTTGLKFEQKLNNLNPRYVTGILNGSKIPNPQQQLTRFA